MRILFIDPVCPKPYDPEVLATQPLGGTEATVIRVAEALAGKGTVVVQQHCRPDGNFFVSAATHNCHYGPLGSYPELKPTHVIALRNPGILPELRVQYPNAKLYLWCHDIFAGGGWVDGFKAVQETGAKVVVVSDWHRGQMYDWMSRLGVSGHVAAKRIYNPIDDEIAPDETPVDQDRLVFFSSPHKGLEHTLRVFERFQDFPELQNMKLYLANPGYFPDAQTEGQRNVVNLGALPHHEVIRHVRSALGVFHLNAVFPETFGLVYAEANAVGTPFITSRMGAVPEVTDHPAELIDVRDAKAVIDRIRQWKTCGRPKVRANPAFRLSRIAREWCDFLAL